MFKMSANNQIEIIEEEGKFFIHENFCVDNQFFPDKETLLETKDDLRDAIKWAENYCIENVVEYGYRIELEEK